MDRIKDALSDEETKHEVLSLVQKLTRVEKTDTGTGSQLESAVSYTQMVDAGIATDLVSVEESPETVSEPPHTEA